MTGPTEKTEGAFSVDLERYCPLLNSVKTLQHIKFDTLVTFKFKQCKCIPKGQIYSSSHKTDTCLLSYPDEKDGLM